VNYAPQSPLEVGVSCPVRFLRDSGKSLLRRCELALSQQREKQLLTRSYVERMLLTTTNTEFSSSRGM